ncbi:alpha/beta hydrolase [Indiicoccus explosivorum]|uniref:alpha/beta hydrolase n=1 Tax=Indiicoccus explosivorum TaxID=1917864 RepID=UPI000B447AE3|nr:alpha/beta fold hydrolase [Indiicoccus explosivorum]
MMRRLLIAAGAVPAAIGVLFTALGLTVSNRVMYIRKKEDEMILQREIAAKRLDEAWFARVPKTEKWVKSPNGYSLKTIFLEPRDTGKYVIISHGVTENKITSIKYARMFERLGFNSVIYDHRRHGESGGGTTSYGHYEKYDLEAVAGALKAHVPDLRTFGIHGESMGAATLLLYAGSVEDAADFYIADSPYSDIAEQILHVMQTTTPLRTRLSVRIGSLFLKMRDGYSLETVSPREAVRAIRKPVLFIHTAGDSFVPPGMSEELHRLKSGDKELRIFRKGGHAQAFNEQPGAYEETVRGFLMKYGFLN